MSEITLWMIIFTCIFFIAGLVLAIVHRKNVASSDPERESDVMRAEVVDEKERSGSLNN